MSSNNLEISWDGAIICLSIAIAFIGSYGVITLYEQYRLCSKENKPKILTPSLLLVLMACCVGGIAIWCMHFVGMSAMVVKDPMGFVMPVRYRIDLTIASLIAVVACCYVGLLLASTDNIFTQDKSDVIDKFVKNARELTIQEIRTIKHKNVFLFVTLFKNMKYLVLGGVFTAAGVCVMHYIGMMAMVMDVEVEWNGGIVFVSVLIALVAASAAYWILFRLLALFPYIELLRIASAVIMSIAVNGMHYTGMAAAKYKYKEGASDKFSDASTVDNMTAVYGALAASMIFIWIVFILSIADLRVWYYNLARVIREADIRYTVNISDPILSKQPFLVEYKELRDADGDAKLIMNFRMKMKNSTSPSGSSNNTDSQNPSQSLSTQIYPKIDECQEFELLKTTDDLQTGAIV